MITEEIGEAHGSPPQPAATSLAVARLVDQCAAYAAHPSNGTAKRVSRTATPANRSTATTRPLLMWCCMATRMPTP